MSAQSVGVWSEVSSSFDDVNTLAGDSSSKGRQRRGSFGRRRINLDSADSNAGDGYMYLLFSPSRGSRLGSLSSRLCAQFVGFCGRALC